MGNNMSKKYWKISIYSLNRAYGGSEEGGWWYTEGDRVREIKKTFLDKLSALKYSKRINELLLKRFGKTREGWSLYGTEVFYRGTPDYFPSRKPIYC